MPPSRTASLTRNFNHSRSITMPNMQEHQQQQQTVDTSNSFARTFSTFRRHQDNIGNSRRMSTAERGSSSCNNNNNFTTSPSMPAYMTLSSTSTISASVSIHGGLSSTTPRFQQQQRQSRLPDQQHQHLPQQLPSQQQFRRRPRPLSADMSMTRTPYNTYANSNHNNVHNPNHPMAMSTSKSEFFRVVRNRLMEEFEGSNDPRHHSSESLLVDSSSASMESSLDYFVNQELNSAGTPLSAWIKSRITVPPLHLVVSDPFLVHAGDATGEMMPTGKEGDQMTCLQMQLTDSREPRDSAVDIRTHDIFAPLFHCLDIPRGTSPDHIISQQMPSARCRGVVVSGGAPVTDTGGATQLRPTRGRPGPGPGS